MLTEEEKKEMPHLRMRSDREKRRTGLLVRLLQALGGLLFLLLILSPLGLVGLSLVYALGYDDYMRGGYLLLWAILLLAIAVFCWIRAVGSGRSSR